MTLTIRKIARALLHPRWRGLWLAYAFIFVLRVFIFPEYGVFWRDFTLTFTILVVIPMIALPIFLFLTKLTTGSQQGLSGSRAWGFLAVLVAISAAPGVALVIWFDAYLAGL